MKVTIDEIVEALRQSRRIFDRDYSMRQLANRIEDHGIEQPSIDALIAEAIEKHDDEMADIRTVNTRKIAQPYLDALIAEIDELAETYSDTSPSRPAYMKANVRAIMDKYRGQK